MVFQNFYTLDGDNTYGAGNEVAYATSSLKAVYMSNVYSGFSFAVGYTPNMGEQGANTSGQLTSGSTWGNFNDVLAVFGKYAVDIDGIGLELVYGTQTGNAGMIGTSHYNDLEERIASLHKKYWMTSNPQARDQMTIILDDLKYELNRRIRAEKSIQNDDKNLDNLINIS